MPRVKGGYTTRRRRKKILKLAKGYFGSKRTLYRTAHEQVMRSLAYAYRDRKQRKRQFRKLWISRINAAAKLNGMKYSTLIHGLSLASVGVNRKMLADIAVHQPEDFTAYCTLAKEALDGKLPEQPVVKVKEPAKKAAKPVEKAEPKVDKKVEPKPEPKAQKKAAVDYDAMLVKELKALAAEKNIEGYSKMLKADLVQALKDLD
ncbi:MAG: 50S ribosomal protein L20 [Acholeplasmataceae bacterium]|nr:MAG: 50S ribosomal protein L20 [Acholeplasmataceae bacterium]